MEKLLVSMMRFSTAMTLFGMSQMQTTMRLMSGQENINHSVDKIRETLDSLSDAVAAEMDKKTKDTLNSFVQATQDAWGQTVESLNMSGMDFSGVLNATSDVMRRTTESMSDWMGVVGVQRKNGGDAEGTAVQAAEALSGTKTTKRASK